MTFEYVTGNAGRTRIFRCVFSTPEYLGSFFVERGINMIVKQILNNNVAIVTKGEIDVIVYSKGISFKKRPGQFITSDEIQKTFISDFNEMFERFSKMLSTVDERYISLVTELIEYGEKILNEEIKEYLNLALLDHLDFTIQRAKKGQFLHNPLSWEIKKFYPKHYQIGEYALELIKQKLGVELPEDEAAAFALHFANNLKTGNFTDMALKTVKAIKDIVNIIQYHYHIQLDEKSMNYTRLITHLQFFIQRVMNKDVYTDSDDALYNEIKELYPDSFHCVSKIEIYIKDKFSINMSRDEKTYLMLHIHRVIMNGERTD